MQSNFTGEIEIDEPLWEKNQASQRKPKVWPQDLGLWNGRKKLQYHDHVPSK